MSNLSSSFSDGQYRAIEVATRATSVLSLLGSFFILGTFLACPYFRKPINRLIFYATFGNILVNIATLISTSALPLPGALKISQLCEFQGVLIQWFMSADACWDFCMATNVLLVFFFGYNSNHLHKLEKWYFLFAYGLPGIPALVFVILDHSGRPIIGPATIWCWVNKESDWMRIAFFYAPVWVVISATFAIYVITGIHIFQKGALLRDFTKAQTQRPDMEFSPVAAEAPANPFAEMNNIVVTTEIGFSVDTEVSAMNPVSSDGDQTSMSSFSSTHNFPGPSKTTAPSPITAPPIRAATPKQDKDKAAEHRRSLYETSDYRATAFAGTSSLPAIMSSPRTRRTMAHVKEGNEAAMSYLKVAMLMFIAMFMIWVPSTVNRLHSFVHKGTPNFGLNFASVVVLPLQGAWAAAIYAYTSRSETKRAYAASMAWLTSRKLKNEHDARPAAEPEDTRTPLRDTCDSYADVAREDVVEHRERVGRDQSAPRDSVVETLTV